MAVIMRYRVTFRKRFTEDGKEADFPATFLNVSDGVIREAEFVERFEPDALHGEDRMEEDDDFLSLGTEVWEFDISPGKEKEFREAVTNSGTAIEIDEADSEEGMPALEGQ